MNPSPPRSKANRAAEQRAIAQAAKRPLPPHIDDDEQEPEVPTRSNRQAMRSESGRATARGRNGEILTRKRTGSTDPYEIDPKVIPDGWDYQWNAISVVGNKEILMDQSLTMAENGWRAVPAERHPGRFMPEGHKGSIIRGGLRLDERPRALSEEARAEEIAKARQLITDRNESLKLAGVKKQIGDGFEMSRKYRGTGGDVRISIDHGSDIPRPKHNVETE